MKSSNLLSQIFEGRSIYRILMNRELRKLCHDWSGRALDLASGPRPSYLPYLPKTLEVKTTDLEASGDGSQQIDFNKSLPFKDQTFDAVFLINALYIVRDRQTLLLEIKRILKHGGQFVVISPLIANEMPAPDDFCRLTYQGLEIECQRVDFKLKKLQRFGERWSSAAYLLDPFWRFRLVKLLIYPLALLFDKLVPKRVRRLHPTPLGYVCLAER